MKRNVLASVAVTAASLLGCPAFAAIDHFSPSDYAVGVAISNGAGGGASGGIEWAPFNVAAVDTRWTTDSQGAPNIAAGSIGGASGVNSLANFIQNGAGAPANPNNDNFTARRAFTPQTSGVFYVSVLARTAADFTFDRQSSTFLLVEVSDTNQTIANFAGQIGQMNITSTWGVRGDGAFADTLIPIVANTTNLLLMKVDFDSRTISGWVNPDLSQPESTPNATDPFRGISNNLATPFTRLNEIRLRGNGNIWQLDNVEVTTVSPFSNVVPEPASLSMLAAGTLLLSRRRN